MTDITPSETYNVTPVGRTVVRGTPLIRAEKILTAAAKAGHLVQIDTVDYKCKKQASGGAGIGWIAYEECPISSKPASIDTAFASGDVVGVVSGGNIELVAYFTNGESKINLDIGDYLCGNNDGTLTKWSPNGTVASTTATNPMPPVARVAESLTIAASAVVKIHVISLI